MELNLSRVFRKIWHYLPAPSAWKSFVKSYALKKASPVIDQSKIYKNWVSAYPPPENRRRPLYLSSPGREAFRGLSGSPELMVSIIIPVYNQSEFTLCCLASLVFHGSRHSFEVIVVDDASTDSTQTLVSRIAGVRMVRMPKRSGFIRTCNEGARMARGRYLVFLNNDTEVTGGWLDALIEPHIKEEAVGITGPKLVFPDGRLQDAGTRVGADGTIETLGRDAAANDPAYNEMREVDAVCGACLAIQRDLFLALGGFDIRYAPAYREDTDLCFQVRKAGKKVFYQPFSTVIHYESVTASSDASQDIRKYQYINQKKFKKKWRKDLEVLSLINQKNLLFSDNSKSSPRKLEQTPDPSLI